MGLPYFPMFPTDFEADTSHLTLAEDGAYNRLLRLCWMTPGCSLPDDETWIIRRMRARSDDEVSAVQGVISEFFTASNGRLSNARLTKEWLAANEAHEKRKTAGRKGGKAKSLKYNEKQLSNDKAKPKQPEPEPEPYITLDTNVSNLRVEAPKKFQEFWDQFPHRHGAKKGRASAQKKYAAAVRSGISEQKILSAAIAYQRDADVLRGYGKGPVPWLNQKCWEDEIATEQPAQPERRTKENDELALINRVAARFGEVDSGEGSNPAVTLFPTGRSAGDYGGGVG